MASDEDWSDTLSHGSHGAILACPKYVPRAKALQTESVESADSLKIPSISLSRSHPSHYFSPLGAPSRRNSDIAPCPHSSRRTRLSILSALSLVPCFLALSCRVGLPRRPLPNLHLGRSGDGVDCLRGECNDSEEVAFDHPSLGGESIPGSSARVGQLTMTGCRSATSLRGGAS